LQPYIENAIRHGLRHKSEGVGKLELAFQLVDDYLYCSIKDNGVGRQKSEEMKGRQHIEYQSKGMELGQKRVDILNEISGRAPIYIQVIDEKDEHGNATGTTVIIKMPLNNEQADNNIIGG
jgi:LytS/YehU family sensor histidine kinase